MGDSTPQPRLLQVDVNNPSSIPNVEGTHGEPAQDSHLHGAHIVQLYTDDGLLLDVLGRFIGRAIGGGGAGVVIATKAHRDGLAMRLRTHGVDAAEAIRQGRYVLADAEETLREIMVSDLVDETRFKKIIGDLLTRAHAAAESKDSRIAVFGELVALLWAAGKPDEAIRIEQLWNDLARTYSFSLLCAYPANGFDSDRHIEPFLRMCAQHSGLVPEENYTGPSNAEERLRTIAELRQTTQELQNALKLRNSEERFRLLVEAVRDYAIFMLDPDGKVISWNAGAERIKGYQGAEIIGKHFSCFYPEEDLRNGKPQHELVVAAAEGRFEDEGWRVRKDGSQFWASVIITAVRDHTGKLIGFGKVTRDSTERMHLQRNLEQEVAEKREAQQKLSDSEGSLRQLSLHLLRTQDEERRRIGRDLHDSLGQSLAAMKISLDSLTSIVGRDSLANQKVEECIELAENSIKEVRTISYLLYPPMLEEMGLKAAIPWYLDGFSARSGIQTTFDAPADFGRLRRDAELALFRILQESLTNIHRHSGSRTASIRLWMNQGLATLEIEDHGKGMPAGLSEQAKRDSIGIPGVGLRGMSERMLQLGGRLEVATTGKGTTVRAVTPIAESSSSSHSESA